MRRNEGLPFVKLMMLVGSMAPLFILVGIRGMGSIVGDRHLWIAILVLLSVPAVIIRWRIARSKKSNDTFVINVREWRNNKEYLFTYLFTVLLPLYSVSITTDREFIAVLVAICFVVFILWNLNLHFINIVFALQGYKVLTLESADGAILLTTRNHIPRTTTELKVHRISNSVFIELEGFPYEEE